MILRFNPFCLGIEAVAKGYILMHEIIDPDQQINMGIMERRLWGRVGTAAAQLTAIRPPGPGSPGT